MKGRLERRGYGVVVTQQLPKLLSRVRVPIAAQCRKTRLLATTGSFLL